MEKQMAQQPPCEREPAHEQEVADFGEMQQQAKLISQSRQDSTQLDGAIQMESSQETAMPVYSHHRTRQNSTLHVEDSQPSVLHSPPTSGTQTPAACRPLLRHLRSLDPSPSGTQTPAVARPLLRRRASHDSTPSYSRHASLTSGPNDENQLNPLTPHSIRSPAGSPPPSQRRTISYNSFMDALRRRLDDANDLPPDEALIEKTYTSPHPFPRQSPLSRPAPLHRRISHEVQDRERELQSELYMLRQQLESQTSHNRTQEDLLQVREGLLAQQADQRQREQLAVNFAVNRILEQQRNQMRVQSLLLERMGEMDLKGRQGSKEAEEGVASAAAGVAVVAEGEDRGEVIGERTRASGGGGKEKQRAE